MTLQIGIGVGNHYFIFFVFTLGWQTVMGDNSFVDFFSF